MVNRMENDSGVTLENGGPERTHYGRGEHPNAVAALEANRETTQYGGENPPPQYQELGLPHPRSIRNSVRHLIGQPDESEDETIAILVLPKGSTKAQKYAAAILNAGAHAVKAKSVPDLMRVADYLTDQVDGKLANLNLNAEAQAIAGMSDEQLDRELAVLRRAEARMAAASAENAPASEPPADAGKAERPDTPTSPARL